MRSWEVGRDLCPGRAGGQELRGPTLPGLPSGPELPVLSHVCQEGHSGVFSWAWPTRGLPALTLGQAAQVLRATQERTRSILRSARCSSQEAAVYLGEVLCRALSQFLRFASPSGVRGPQEAGAGWESQQPGGQLRACQERCEGARRLVVHTEWT